MTERKPDQASIGDEFKELAKQLTATIKAVAGSEQLRTLGSELRDGMKDAAKEVEETVAKLRQSDEVQRLRSRAADVADSFKTGEAQREIREEVVEALQALNERLSALRARVDPDPTPPTDADEPYTGQTRKL
jgi:methyl-accepting chemotaxis protein